MKNDVKMEYEPVTPYFLIHEDELEYNITGFHNALQKYWPNSAIAYSIKTNALPWILKWMNNHSVYAEAVSGDEYQLAKMCGFPGELIVFNGPIKSKEQFMTAVSEGALINIDSERELNWLEEHKPVQNRLGIRININPDIFDIKDVGYQEDGFRFGFSVNDLQRVIEHLDRLYVGRSFGLHLHVNSITRSVEVYRNLAAFAAKIINEYHLKPAFIDMGGGFFGGVPGKPAPDDYISVIYEELKTVVDVEHTQLIIEPGSAAVGSTVDLITTVIDVKDNGKAKIVTTDGSRIHIDPLWQKTKYLYTTNASKEPAARQVICGYTCMDHDRLMVIDDEPELSTGDQITYHRVGNYTVTYGGPFIKMFPEVYVQRGNELLKVRSRMSVEDYYRIETADDTRGEE